MAKVVVGCHMGWYLQATCLRLSAQAWAGREEARTQPKTRDVQGGDRTTKALMACLSFDQLPSKYLVNIFSLVATVHLQKIALNTYCAFMVTVTRSKQNK